MKVDPKERNNVMVSVQVLPDQDHCAWDLGIHGHGIKNTDNKDQDDQINFKILIRSLALLFFNELEII